MISTKDNIRKALIKTGRRLVKEKSRKCSYPQEAGTLEDISVTQWLKSIERGE